MKKLVIAAFIVAFSAPIATAGSSIERACLQSDRKAVSRNLCGCIQDAADLVLDKRDQKMAAKFFKDPHRAQEIRQSDNRSHEAFWKRYKQFGNTAQAYCG
ncbi:hypothetical protein [Actibacterium lipolyticum]|uniref:Arginine transporter n=1 Tax=Actibacterium lipolyticum TaxID=1524263 RepID=A0A238JPA5_9RHOB|nr:hypothetical protein [Actibacterium lipolyticum]SMX32024.1 hypothetical protein COL8621_00686 [Actibacterium lipolyticum]